jgi:hypothetical protein
MGKAFTHFGGIDFSGAREPLSNLWSVVGVERERRLRIVSVRPHAFRADLATYVAEGWRAAVPDDDARTGAGRILWGADFPFGLPSTVATTLGLAGGWSRQIAWVADRPAEEVREAAGEHVRSTRATDTGGALAPLDLRLFKQTVEGLRWLHDLREEHDLAIYPQAVDDKAEVALIEVYPSGTAQELGIPRRRAPSRPGEVRARAAALRTYLEFADPNCEALFVTLEDAWDAAIACLTAFLCRDDLDQPGRVGASAAHAVATEGWIYRPPSTIA